MDAKFISNARDYLKETNVKKLITTSNYQYYDEMEGNCLVFDHENEMVIALRTTHPQYADKENEYEISCVGYGDIFIVNGYTSKEGIEKTVDALINKGLVKSEDREKMLKNLFKKL